MENMKDCLDILVIDDDEVDRMNVQHLLDKEGVKAVVHEASDSDSYRNLSLVALVTLLSGKKPQTINPLL